MTPLSKQEPATIPPRTEDRVEATRDIDRISVEEGLALLAAEFRRAFDAFETSAVKLAPLVEAVVSRTRRGGSVHLFGAGTSGRMAALDAAEIPPTFDVSPTLFQAHIAGGEAALTSAVEDAEDDTHAGAEAGSQLQSNDVAIGVSASGRTPYVLAALAAARTEGAFTALIDCNGTNPTEIDCHVTLPTGPEAIAGSTRLNAATAQKLALNAISTLAMVHLGRTYSNLMVYMQPNNAKLRKRLAQMLRDITGAPDADIAAALATADNEGSVALALLAREWDLEQARTALDEGIPLRAIVDGGAAGRIPPIDGFAAQSAD
ncbi:N-acetylmuramic acid 6-phosphate etherase [Phytoactinopolyspora mesophila]|uniref:N-acetylmuramic acid 6-phosphate etherase n=1 Tax=Phytoactinopolyspora mesophila TaxID=2650750 RepID=UPI003CCDBF81